MATRLGSSSRRLNSGHTHHGPGGKSIPPGLNCAWTRRSDHPPLHDTSSGDRKAVEHLVQRHFRRQSRDYEGVKGETTAWLGGGPAIAEGKPALLAALLFRFDTLSGTSDQLSYPGSPIQARSSHQLSTIPTGSFFSRDHRRTQLPPRVTEGGGDAPSAKMPSWISLLPRVSSDRPSPKHWG